MDIQIEKEVDRTLLLLPGISKYRLGKFLSRRERRYLTRGSRVTTILSHPFARRGVGGLKTNFINYTHRRGGGVIQENWKQPFSSAVKLGDFVGGERARGLLRHFVWKVLIANLRGAETIFYSSTHRPTIRVYARAYIHCVCVCVV